MRQEDTLRRVGYWILCSVPLLIAPLTGARDLRIPVVHELLGVLLFATIIISGWWLARPTSAPRGDDSLLRLAGTLLLVPTSLIALLWVGLATPWDATPSENQMRYAVLLAGSIGVTAGFVVLKEALSESGERVYSTLAFAASLLAGATYVVWTSFQLGAFALTIAEHKSSPAVASMNNVFDALLFAAGALTYLATAAFAHALARARWLGRNASRAYIVLSLVALALLLLRGVSFPSPTSGPAPWYTQPGFIIGIPAVPWFMPYFLGILLLRRAGNSHVQPSAGALPPNQSLQPTPVSSLRSSPGAAELNR